eukprot:scaffold393_cov363-Pavlova_lutheri.AAC.1
MGRRGFEKGSTSRDYVYNKATTIRIKNKNAPPPIPTHNQGKPSSPFGFGGSAGKGPMPG